MRNYRSHSLRLLNCILLTILCVGCTVKPPAAIEAPATDPAVAAAVDVPDEVVIIDVRSDEEWDSGHLDAAIHIPHTEIAQKIEGVTSNKDAKIVLYCAVGGRAGKAKKVLDLLGYTRVENAGGYDDIKKQYK